MPVKHKLLPSNPDSETLQRLSTLLVSEGESASLAINRYNALCAALQDYSPREEQIAYDLTVENWERLNQRCAVLEEALDEIGGLCRALRQGGPDPMDLEGLSNALEEAVNIAHGALAASPAPEMQSLDEHMRAAGMLSVADLLKGAPLDTFVKHAGVNDLPSLLQWAEMRRGECLKMQARYDIGEKDKGDELYEWVVAHCAVFTELHVNIRAALATQTPLAIKTAGAWDGLDLLDALPNGSMIYASPTTQDACTCPSGDGSLRHPCPRHQGRIYDEIDVMGSSAPAEQGGDV